MSIPTQIEFRHMEPSDALSQVIEHKIEKLGHFFDHILQCHVIVEAPHRHHHKGQQFQVGIRLSVPGKTLNVNQRGAAPAHEDAYVAVRDAFDAMQHQLKTYADKLQGNVKNHRHRADSPAPAGE